MSIENELRLLTEAIQQQVEAINTMIQVNQQILELLIDVTVPEDGQPLRDMEGNPV